MPKSKKLLFIIGVIFIIIMAIVVMTALLFDPYIKLLSSFDKLSKPQHLSFNIDLNYKDSNYVINGEGDLGLNDAKFDGDIFAGTRSIQPGFDVKVSSNYLYLRSKINLILIDSWYRFPFPKFKEDKNIDFKNFFNVEYLGVRENYYYFTAKSKVHDLYNMSFDSFNLGLYLDKNNNQLSIINLDVKKLEPKDNNVKIDPIDVHGRFVLSQTGNFSIQIPDKYINGENLLELITK